MVDKVLKLLNDRMEAGEDTDIREFMEQNGEDIESYFPSYGSDKFCIKVRLDAYNMYLSVFEVGPSEDNEYEDEEYEDEEYEDEEDESFYTESQEDYCSYAIGYEDFSKLIAALPKSLSQKKDLRGYLVETIGCFVSDLSLSNPSGDWKEPLEKFFDENDLGFIFTDYLQ